MTKEHTHKSLWMRTALFRDAVWRPLSSVAGAYMQLFGINDPLVPFLSVSVSRSPSLSLHNYPLYLFAAL